MSASVSHLRLVRGATDELRETALDLGIVERYLEKRAEMGLLTFTREQLMNYAQVCREGRLLLEAIRRDQ
jgi:hypothetical protein